jgi:hypothetical protein
VRSRHGHKGGSRCGAPRRCCLLQPGTHSSGISLRDTEPLGQGREGAGRGIATGAPRREEGGEQGMNPLMGFALAHAEQASLHDLERRGFEGGEDEEPASFRRRGRTVLGHREPAGGPRFPIEAPRGERRADRRLEGRDQLRKLVARHTGQIQELRGAGLHIGEPYTGHT